VPNDREPAGGELRMTPQRAAVLEVLRAAHDHPTAQEVYERVRDRSPGIGFATVYRSLNLLVQGGQALMLALGDSAARYDANVARHDHLVCDECGRAVDVDARVPARLLDSVAGDSGFTVTGYDLQFRGRCPDCSRTQHATN
jgi:Fur family ferric uptake transcriptional regulator/Fur family peroxide stress response transcriptional regulator